MKGILGLKSGMTTIFTEDGKAIPVTIVEVKPNVVLQVKTLEKDGYNSLKLGLGDKKENKSNKSEIGIGKKANTSAKYFIKEIKDMSDFKQGDIISLNDVFKVGQYVDVTGTSKGKGFQGAIKRHGQSRGPMAHGSKFHRAPGSSGDIRGTVKRTKKMPGHMGHEKITVQNLEIISINIDLNAILIKGSIPGPNKSLIIIKESIKNKINKNEPKKLVDLKEIKIKNELLEEGKKYGAKIVSSMSIEEMKSIIVDASIKHEKELKEHKDLLEKAKELKINKADRMKLSQLKLEVAKVEKLLSERKQKEEIKEGENK